MMNMNRVLAEENIAQEPKLIELKAIVNELSDEGKSLLSQVQDKINDYSKLKIILCFFSSVFQFFHLQKQNRTT